MREEKEKAAVERAHAANAAAVAVAALSAPHAPGSLLADAQAEIAAQGERPKKRLRRKKDPLAPKKPPCAFLAFCNENRGILRKENPGLSVTDQGVRLGLMWKNADAATKEPYLRNYNASLLAYHREKEKYREQLLAASRAERAAAQAVASPAPALSGPASLATGVIQPMLSLSSLKEKLAVPSSSLPRGAGPMVVSGITLVPDAGPVVGKPDLPPVTPLPGMAPLGAPMPSGDTGVSQTIAPLAPLAPLPAAGGGGSSDAGGKKRKPSCAFLAFCNDKRGTLEPGLSLTEQGARLGLMWKAADQSVRSAYEKAYEEQMAAYQAGSGSGAK